MKYIRNIFIILLLFVLGIIIGYSADFGAQLIKESDNYVNFNFIYVITIFVITYFIAIAIHEIAHFITFVRNGVSMSALYILYFLFIKENNKWELKLKPNSITTLGGIAIPDFDYVKDENHFKKLQSAYSKALIWGPISSILLFLFNTIVFIVGYLFIKNNIINTIILINFLSSTIITLLIIVTSTFKSDLVVGDFAAYKLVNEDEFFTAMQLYQASIYSTNPKYVKENNNYLRKLLVQKLSEKLTENDFNIYTLSVVDSFLINYLAKNTETLPKVIESYMDLLLDKHVLEKKKDENSISLMFHVIIHISEYDIEKARKTFNSFKKYLNLKIAYVNYYIKQTEHILNIKDHSHYLKQKENIVISQAHSIYKHFEGYYIDEVKINSHYINKA